MSTKKILPTKLENFGGQGDTPNGELSRSDMKMIERAIKREWNLPDVVMDALPSKVASIFQNENNVRNRLTAAKILLNMHAENRETAKLSMAYHGIGAEHSVNVSIANNVGVDVNQKMTVEDVREAVNELNRMGLASDENAKPAIRSTPADD